MSSAFGEILQRGSALAPAIQTMIMLGPDGVPVDSVSRGGGAGAEVMAAEIAALAPNGLNPEGGSVLGEVREITLSTQTMTGLLVMIGGGYSVFASVAPGEGLGQPRFALRVTALRLEREIA